ncbi:replication protein A 70 kDa DNA-binding subunit C-like protein, partial [Tanacetum coccineum]
MSSKVAENMSTHAEQAQTDLLPNNAIVATSSEAGQSKTHLFLNELTDGVTGTIIVMVCSIWDVHAIIGRYLSMDFIGNAIHCTAKANIAHNFLKLKEGLVYSIKDFVVQGNKDEYRIFRDHAFILEFDGATSVRIASGKDDSFVRYPFQLMVMLQTSAGPLTKEPALGLWTSTSLMAGGEGEGSLNQVAAHVDYSQPKDGTLESLLIWAHNRKNNSSTFNCRVKIDNIKTRKGWNFPLCSGDKCKKGIAHKEGSFWCEACNKNVEYLVL